MKTKVVTFDAADTLVRVRWSPGGFALDCARAVGLELGDAERAVYEQSLRSRWSQYQDLNTTRDPVACDAFWQVLAEDWLTAIGHPANLAAEMTRVAPDLLYSDSSDMFVLFDDVHPVLDALEQRGVRVGVISNWDYSLHRVLKARSVHHRFEHVIASLEEGVEKPHPRLFEITLEKFGVEPHEAIHVGDNPLDDLQGAREFGMGAYLIDRNRQSSTPPYLASLTDLLPLLD